MPSNVVGASHDFAVLFNEDVDLMNGMEIIISVLQWQCIKSKCRMSTYNYEAIHEGGECNEMFTTPSDGQVRGAMWAICFVTKMCHLMTV